MSKMITFKNPHEAIEKFRGKKLISRCYQSDPEMDFYVGDLIDINDIASAIGEIESREADLTEDGEKYLIYSFENSDLEKQLQENVYSKGYIENFNELISYTSRLIDINFLNSNRVFNSLMSRADMELIAQHLGRELNSLQDQSLQERDEIVRLLRADFRQIFSDKFSFISHNFTARGGFKETKSWIELYMLKEDYTLTFHPTLFFQELEAEQNSGFDMKRKIKRIELLGQSQNYLSKISDHDEGLKLLLYIKDMIGEIAESSDVERALINKDIMIDDISPGKFHSELMLMKAKQKAISIPL